MNRNDWLSLGVRGVGLFFACRAILLLPVGVNAIRTRDTWAERLGVDAQDVVRAASEYSLMFGVTDTLTHIGVFAIAAAIFLLIPVGRRAVGAA